MPVSKLKQRQSVIVNEAIEEIEAVISTSDVEGRFQ
jgi:hypothetical protein